VTEPGLFAGANGVLDPGVWSVAGFEELRCLAKRR
jgi:hypothetical protein